MQLYMLFMLLYCCVFYSVSVVKGKYPAQLLHQWDVFHQRNVSENDRPGMKTSTNSCLHNYINRIMMHLQVYVSVLNKAQIYSYVDLLIYIMS